MSPTTSHTEPCADDGRTEDAPSKRPLSTEFLAAGVFIAIAAVGAYSLSVDPYLEMGASGTDPGPAFVPWIAVIVLGIGGVVHLLIEFSKALRNGGVAFTNEFTIPRLWMPVALIVLLLVYAGLIKSLGFFWPSVGFSLICVAALHWRTGDSFTPRYLIQIPIEALLVTGAVYGVFRYGILVPLP